MFDQKRALAEQEARQFAQALLNADAVARARGDRFGLCDCVDNAGNPYPSQWLTDLLHLAVSSYELTPDVETGRTIAKAWSVAHQWPK